MNAPSRINRDSGKDHDPALIAFVKALARQAAARDIDRARQRTNDSADRHLRPVLQPPSE